MKKIITLLLITSFSSTFLWAQDAFPIFKQGKWGVVNLNGEMVISPSYDFISNFTAYGLATVQKGNQVGVINEKGDNILPMVYQQIDLLDTEQVVVWQDYKCGVKNLQGEEIIPMIYHSVKKHTDQTWLAGLNHQYGLFDSKGNELVPVMYQRFYEFKESDTYALFGNEGSWGAINANGELVLTPVYEKIYQEGNHIIGVKPFNQGIDVVTLNALASVSSKSSYANDKEYQASLKSSYRKAVAQEVMEKEKPQKAVWTRVGTEFMLLAPSGKYLGKGLSFYYVEEDEDTKLALGRRLERNGSDVFYLFDMDTPSLKFKSPVQDFMLADYRDANWARVTVDTLWDGLINHKGELKKTLTFNGSTIDIINIGNFFEGRAFVQTSQAYAYVDQDANMITAPEYTLATDFANGYAIVKKGGLFGAIDKDGKLILPCVYDGLSKYKKGVFRAKKGSGELGKWGLLSKEGKEIVPFEYQQITEIQDDGTVNVQKGKYWGRFNTKGEALIPVKVPVDYLTPFENGLSRLLRGEEIVKSPTGEQKAYQFVGYLDEKGKVLVKPIYTTIIGFEEAYQQKKGLAIVKNKEGKIGYINARGEELIPPIYDEIIGYENVWNTSSSIALVRQNGTIGGIDKDAKVIIPIEYEQIDESIFQLKNGLALAQKNKKWGALDHQGKEVIPFEYDYLGNPQSDRILAKKQNDWGVIDEQGKIVVGFTYQKIEQLKTAHESIFRLYRDTTAWYHISSSGVILPYSEKEVEKPNEILSTKYDYISDFNKDGLAIISKKGDKKKKGLINAEGKVIIKPAYKNIGYFHEGIAYAQMNGKSSKDRLYGYLNEKGSWVIDPTFTKAKDFSDGLAPVSLRGKWGYIGKDGQWKITAQYKNADPFYSGIAVVSDSIIINSLGEQLGIYKGSGELIAPFANNRSIVKIIGGQFHLLPTGSPAYPDRYDEVTPFAGNFALAKRGEIWELTREKNNQTVKQRFSKRAKESYLKKFGYGRKVVSLTGDVSKDKNWEMINNGQWKIISKGGDVIGDAVFDEVKIVEDGFLVKMSRASGLANYQGEIIVPAECQKISLINGKVIRVEKSGEILYYKTTGEQLVK